MALVAPIRSVAIAMGNTPMSVNAKDNIIKLLIGSFLMLQ